MKTFPTKKVSVIGCVFLLTWSCLSAQVISQDILNKKWNALWIASTNKAEHDYGVYHFRKTFSITTKPSSFIIHVSADNRYKLYVNGVMVSLGPAKSDLYHWKYETIDIAPYMLAGHNSVTAVVWNFGRQRPLSQISYQTAFIVQGNTLQEEIVNTNKTWKCLIDSSYTALTPDLINTYYVMGPGDKVDYNYYPQGWQHTDFNDSAWSSASELTHGLPKGTFTWSENWMLEPGTLPQMERTPQHYKSVREATGITLPKDFSIVTALLTIPAHAKVKLLLDQGELTNAYSKLTFSKGRQATVTLTYTEALYVDEGNKKPWKDQQTKGNRDDVKGKRFVGVQDMIISNGAVHQEFTSLDFRTFRYVLVEIETSNEPLQIEDISSVFIGYPFKQNATFETGDVIHTKIMETGWHTARLCATETYTDCPYYEQLQYIGDTRIQCMVSLYNSGDDRLVRNAITQLDQSRLAEGITQSRYPSSLAQHIPTFSLWWIGMLHDYYRYGRDTEFIKQFLPGERQVLWFFKNHQAADGRLKNAPYWEFTDWAEEGGWGGGVSPRGEDQCTAPLDLQLLLAYQTAATLEENIGMKDYALLFRSQANVLRKIIKQKYWDDARELFADNAERKQFSQHTNTLAILTELVKGDSAHAVAYKILSDPSLTQATIYFKYYVNQALAKAGYGNTYLDQLTIWKESLKQGLTTWPEISNTNATRSDCHAWGASPNIEFLRIVLGIDSDDKGFSKIKIEPHLGNLKQAKGSMPHPNGEITVSYTSDKKNKWHAIITIPTGTTGSFIWMNKMYPLQPGLNNLSL